MLMEPTKTAGEIRALCVEGVRKLPADRDYYVRPMFFATSGLLLPEPGAVEFTLAIFEAPLPPEVAGSACLSSYRRSAPDQAPTDAKAGCLYPNSQRAEKEALDKGFTAAVMLDPEGNVAEYAHANFWMARGGVAITPAPNGTFLNGITKQRVMGLLRDAGVEVVERTIHPGELADADEIWVTGNYGKVQTMTGWEDRNLQPGPVFRRARDLYMDFVETCRVV
jgi:branched-chain amino acid aminotransferase